MCAKRSTSGHSKKKTVATYVAVLAIFLAAVLSASEFWISVLGVPPERVMDVIVTSLLASPFFCVVSIIAAFLSGGWPRYLIPFSAALFVWLLYVVLFVLN